MAVYQKTSGSPLLYDTVTNDVVGMKDPDGSEWLFTIQLNWFLQKY